MRDIRPRSKYDDLLIKIKKIYSMFFYGTKKREKSDFSPSCIHSKESYDPPFAINCTSLIITIDAITITSPINEYLIPFIALALFPLSIGLIK